MSGNRKKTILITGINGFLGSYLAKELYCDYNVIGLGSSSENIYRIKDFSFKVYFGNDSLEKIFKENKIFAIIHAATLYRKNQHSIATLIKTNILLPVKLYELANFFGVKLFFNTDSFFNNPHFNYTYLSEYTLSKKHALVWLKQLKGNCNLINMKIFHMYGPYDSNNKFIMNIISLLEKNVPKIDLTKGEQKRDFIFIKDVVNAYKILLKKEDFKNNYLEVEIGTGKATSIKDIVLLMRKLTNSKTKLNFGAIEYRKNEIFESKANNNVLKKLGWKPKFTLFVGLKSTVVNNEK